MLGSNTAHRKNDRFYTKSKGRRIVNSRFLHDAKKHFAIEVLLAEAGCVDFEGMGCKRLPHGATKLVARRFGICESTLGMYFQEAHKRYKRLNQAVSD